MKKTHAVIVKIIIIVAIFALLWFGVTYRANPQDRTALQATSTVWPPPYTPNATTIARVEEHGFRPPGYVAVQNGKIYRNFPCECGMGGTYSGAVPCNDEKIAIVPNLVTARPSDCFGKPVAYGLGTPTVIPRIITQTPTITAIPPTMTSTTTPIPIPQCIRVVWDKGTAAKGLNIRPGPTMYNNPDGRSYLGPGFVFKPLDAIETWEGWFYKVTEPSGWIAFRLYSRPNDIYAEYTDCP